MVIAGVSAVAWAGAWTTAGYLLPGMLGYVTAYLGVPVVVLVAGILGLHRHPTRLARPATFGLNGWPSVRSDGRVESFQRALRLKQQTP